MRDLRWVPVQTSGGEGACADAEVASPVSVDSVTRQMETYRMTCDRPLRPYDIVRARRKPSEMPPE